jgi:hypothetical protein
MGKKFHLRTNPWTQDFRNINYSDNTEKGVTYYDTKQVWITLHMHESLQDIISTILHESLHNALALDVEKTDKRAMNVSDTMDIEQEHMLIKKAIWAYNDWVNFD